MKITWNFHVDPHELKISFNFARIYYSILLEFEQSKVSTFCVGVESNGDAWHFFLLEISAENVPQLRRNMCMRHLTKIFKHIDRNCICSKGHYEYEYVLIVA